jgi:hypothetical protein
VHVTGRQELLAAGQLDLVGFLSCTGSRGGGQAALLGACMRGVTLSSVERCGRGGAALGFETP